MPAPAAIPVFVNLSKNPPTVHAELTSIAQPTIESTLRVKLTDEAAFHTAGVIDALPAGAVGRLVIKAENAANGALLFHDSAFVESGTGTSARYTFDGVLDCSALRTALGGADFIIAIAQIEWTLSGDTEPNFSKSFPIRINNAYYRPTDDAPVLADEYTFEINADESAIEVSIGGVSKGFLHLFTTAP